MKFGSHLGKGLWAVAVKTLPVINGIATVFLVIRTLPQQEYGAFVLVQTVFAFATALAGALALMPLIKYAAEKEDRGPYIAATLFLYGIFFAAVSLLALALREPFVRLVAGDGAAAAAELIPYLPALFATVFYRNFAVALLQASYQLKRIFAIEAVQLLGIPLGVVIMRALGRFETATDFLLIILAAQALSTLVALHLTRRETSVPMPLRRTVLSEIWRFGRFTFGGTAFYAVFAQLDVFFVSAHGGLVAAATYNAAKVFMKVFDLVNQVVQMFLIPFSSKRSAAGETAALRTAAEKTIAFSTIALLPVFLVMAFFPEQILRLLYAEKYVQGAWIVRILSLMALVTPWGAVTSSCMVGVGKVQAGFWMSIVLVVLSTPLYALLTPLFGGAGTILGYVIAIVAVTAVSARVLRPMLPLEPRAVARRWRDVREFLKSLPRKRGSTPP
jgi:O-antigen/teichoic acid export membrane protein